MKVCQAHAANLETLKRAFRDDAVCLMEVRVVATGEVVAAICAVGQDGNELTMTPFAVMLNGNPYELLQAPNLDGGFYPVEKGEE